jgi:hypothetical protein
MKRRFVLLAALIALLTSCQSLTDKPTGGVGLPKVGDTFRGGKVLTVEKVQDAPESSVGRYQMATTATKILKLDTVTGQTWVLGANGVWEALPQITPGGGASKSSEPYNTFEVIATRPPLSDFALPEGKRPKPVEELIRALPGVVSVKRVDPNDPLGILTPPPPDKKTRP